MKRLMTALSVMLCLVFGLDAMADGCGGGGGGKPIRDNPLTRYINEVSKRKLDLATSPASRKEDATQKLEEAKARLAEAYQRLRDPHVKIIESSKSKHDIAKANLELAQIDKWAGVKKKPQGTAPAQSTE